MSKKRFFIPLAAFSLLLTSMIACNANNNNNNPSGSEPPAGDTSSNDATSSVDGGSSDAGSTSSQAGGSSSNAGGSSSAEGGSSSQEQHTHDYNATAKSVVKNADDKNVSLYECKSNDGAKRITVAFTDYSEITGELEASIDGKYDEVTDADIRATSVMLKSGCELTWKFNLDKAVTGAKVYFGAVATSSGHKTQKLAEKYKVKANDGSLAALDQADSVTYSDVGLTQNTRNYFYAATFDLVAGENSITLRQGSKGSRLLFGGDVRIEYEGEANPVAAPATGYDITFVPAEHCKVEVYIGANETVETNKTQSVNADALDDQQHFIPAKYVAPVDDDPATADDETVVEVKPEVLFKLVFDDGYTADGNDITISGTMGTEWNKLCSGDDDNSYNITKIKAAITVTIAVRAVTGNEKAGYLGTFNIQNGRVVVYQGEKNKTGDNIDTAEDGKYLSRVKKGGVSKTKAQFNFEIIPDEGYEFNSGLELGGESSPIGVTQFATGNFGNFKRNGTNGNLYSITKVASDIVLNIVCTQVQA